MSYIHSHNDNYYEPSESLSELFKELVVKPFKNPNPPTQAWIDYVKNKTFEYHRKTILEQGQTNFDESFEGLTLKEKVLLYCFHYMPMHLFSSYHIFTKHLTSVSDKVIFIDFGCGPLTSGIAFWASTRQSDITYVGIDSSQGMRDKAREINKHGPYGSEPFFRKGKGRVTSDWNRLSQSLDDYIMRGDQTQIIFNFCYLLASNTLDIENLSNVLIQIVEKYNQHKMFVIYQNPRIPKSHTLQTSKLHENWYFLKTQLSMFQSQITQSNAQWFSYDSLVEHRYTPGFYFDILSNNPEEQLTFFPALHQQSDQQQPPSRNQEAIATIDGLQYIEDYITEVQHDWSLERIDEHQWLDDLRRRVQHYGFKYNYKARKVDMDMRIGELPEWLHRLSEKLYEDRHMPEVADQVIVNEYLPGQGIASHIDCEPCFKDTIVSLSLGSGCVMNFTNKSDKTKKIPVWLAPRSLVVLTGEARYEWLHGIAARKSDVWDGEKYERQRRVSLTFRKVIIKTAKR